MASDSQTFRAASMPEAFALVKRSLGPDAVIVSTRTLGGAALLSGHKVEIVAARSLRSSPQGSGPMRSSTGTHTAPADARATVTCAASTPAEPAPAPLRSALHASYEKLVAAEIGEALAHAIHRSAQVRVDRGDAPDEALREVLRETIRDLVAEAPSPAATARPSGEPSATGGAGETPARAAQRSVIALVGPAGVGKTTTCAKLAAQYSLRRRFRVLLLSLDVHRPAGCEQLAKYAELVGASFASAQTVAGVHAALQSAPRSDVVLVDTCGLSPNEAAGAARLGTLLKAARPTETHLVLPAAWRTTALARAARACASLNPTRLVLTHLDEALGMGVVLNASSAVGLRLSYLCDGQRVPNDLHAAGAEPLTDALLAELRGEAQERGA